MKKTFILVSFLALAGLSIGCSSQLDVPHNGVLDESSYYKSDEDAAAAIAAAYQDITAGSGEYTFEHVYKSLNGYLGDEYWAGQMDRTNEFCILGSYSFDANDILVQAHYKHLYDVIGKCNMVIDNVKGDTPFQKQAVAEAKTLRAWMYFELTTLWEQPALVKHVSAEQPGNASREELWAFIETDLEEAVNSNALSEKVSLTDRSNYRVTKQYAQALLGKAYLWQGKNAQAAAVLDQVIGSGLYGLWGGTYGDFYDLPNENNEEVMFASNRVKDSDNPLFTYFPCFNGLSLYTRPGILTTPNALDLPLYSFGGFVPRGSLYDAFVAEEGVDGYRLNQSIKTYAFMNAAGFGISADGVENSEGYYTWKGRYLDSQSELLLIAMISDRDAVWMRYAEVLLMAAEANIGIDQAKADKYLNEVRHRAGLGDKTCNLEAIKTERRLELFGDFCRYKDLQRWGDAATVLADAGKTEPEFSAAGVTWKSDRTTYGYKTGKNEYLPIPHTETLINDNMKQTSSAW